MLIFLVGFMGSGKSFLGKLWASKYDLDFYDLDTLIEHTNHITVQEIFATKGEYFFREVEALVLRTTDQFTNAIVACGGGTPCFFNNMNWMNNNGITVFLNPNKSSIYTNLLPQKMLRPLIANLSDKELVEFILTKLEERLPFYNQSKITLQSENLNEDGFQIILQNLKNA